MKLFDKEKRLVSITCIFSLLVLLLPFVKTDIINNTRTMIGLAATWNSRIGLLLIICPVVLLVLNYLNLLEKNHTLSIAVPIICIIVLLIVRAQAKQFCSPYKTNLGDLMARENGYAYVTTHLRIGGILALLSYIATLVFTVGRKKKT